MASDQPSDWDRAWTDYLGPLEEKYPDHPYKEELAELRKTYDERMAEHRAQQAAKSGKPISEGQWFFEKGLRLRNQGKVKEARQVWRALVKAYGDVPAEKPWAHRAEQELAQDAGDEPAPPAALLEAAERARKLEADGKKDEAQKVRAALHTLYPDEPGLEALLKGK
jgi:hypothetical protein